MPSFIQGVEDLAPCCSCPNVPMFFFILAPCCSCPNVFFHSGTLLLMSQYLFSSWHLAAHFPLFFFIPAPFCSCPHVFFIPAPCCSCPQVAGQAAGWILLACTPRTWLLHARLPRTWLGNWPPTTHVLHAEAPRQA